MHRNDDEEEEEREEALFSQIHPPYDNYTTVALFWEISDGESDAEEFTEEAWSMIMRGRPRPTL